MKNYVHVLIVLLAVGLAGCGPETGEVRIDIEELLSKPKTYVGSDQCEFCHLEHYNSWKTTLHSRTLQDVTKNMDALVAAIDPAIIRSDLKRIEKSLRVPVEKIYIPELSEIKYTLGMQWEQGFLVEKNGTLYVAPIQYSAKEEHWITYREKDWDQRPWIKKCAGCHVTGVDLEKQTFFEARVGCEACHGPASLHVALPETAVFEKHRTIVNPSHLPVGFRTQICGACHSRGKSTKVKDIDWPVGYIPGRALGMYYKATSYAAGDRQFVYPNEFAKGRYMQFNDWKQSTHAREGVTCISCHYVHRLGTPPTQFQTKGAGSQQCLLCHKALNTNMAHSIHSFANCIGCHMPRIVKNGTGTMVTRSHTFKALLPKETLADPAVPNSCQTCHKHQNTDLAVLQKLFDSLSQKSLLRVHQTRPRW